MSEHTKEPWVEASGEYNEWNGWETPPTHPSVYDNNLGSGIFYSYDDDIRARACVNALAGLNPEAVKDVVEALENLIEQSDIETADRSANTLIEARIREARAAIAKLKGK